jgi:hypothetical protein
MICYDFSIVDIEVNESRWYIPKAIKKDKNTLNSVLSLKTQASSKEIDKNN